MTAQAFLFTTALGSGDKFGRVVASLLSLIVSILCISLMARHRQAEVTDAHWLSDYEHAYLDGHAAHGPDWRARREETDLGAGPLGHAIPLWPGFVTWVLGLAGFGLAAIAALIHAVVTPERTALLVIAGLVLAVGIALTIWWWIDKRRQ